MVMLFGVQVNQCMVTFWALLSTIVNRSIGANGILPLLAILPYFSREFCLKCTEWFQFLWSLSHLNFMYDIDRKLTSTYWQLFDCFPSCHGVWCHKLQCLTDWAWLDNYPSSDICCLLIGELVTIWWNINSASWLKPKILEHMHASVPLNMPLV